MMKKLLILIFISSLSGLTNSVQASDALSITTEQYANANTTVQTNLAAVATVQSFQSHVWFYSVDVQLSNDINNNGYYHRLLVNIDADTSEPYQQVFAEFTLLPTYGDERLFYTSSVFEIFGQQSADWLAIDTLLDRQYPKDQYMLIIRLYDARNGYLLAEISGYDDSQLDYLPLEDYQRDRYVESSTTVEVSAGGTGGMLLLGLCLLIAIRHKTRLTDQ